MLRAGVSDAVIDAAFNRFLTGIPLERLRALERLHATHSIYMLSNTNAIMWHSRIAEEFRKDGHDMQWYFDGWVPSFEVHAYKPDPEIFRIARERFSLEPARTLFLDAPRPTAAPQQRWASARPTCAPALNSPTTSTTNPNHNNSDSEAHGPCYCGRRDV